MAKPVWAATAAGSWATGANWDTGSAPVNGDEVLFRSNEYDVNAGLGQSAVTVDELEIEASFTGDIGTAAAELELGATLVHIGRQSGGGTAASGSNRIKINLGSVQSAINIWSTATSSDDDDLPPVRLRGTHASNLLNMYSGIVGIALNDPDDVATLVTINLFGGFLNLGAGCTLTTINVDGQATEYVLRSAVTTLNHNQGTGTIYGSGARTTISLRGGTLNDYGTGTTTTANVYSEATLNKWSAAATISTLNLYGTLDLSRATGAITLTNTNILSDGAVIFDPAGKAVFSNAAVFGPGVRSFTYIGKGGSSVLITV